MYTGNNILIIMCLLGSVDGMECTEERRPVAGNGISV